MNGVGLVFVLFGVVAIVAPLIWWLQGRQRDLPDRRGLDALGQAVDAIRRTNSPEAGPVRDATDGSDRRSDDPSEPGGVSP